MRTVLMVRSPRVVGVARSDSELNVSSLRLPSPSLDTQSHLYNNSLTTLPEGILQNFTALTFL